ncbi:MAG: cell division protein FtsA [Bacilli bacterium]|nr:cell division protein FtsA [Bacilli bacterium]
MNKILTGIEIGTDSIKIIVVEKIRNEFHLLATTKVKSSGLKRGEIIDTKKVVEKLKVAIKNIEEQIGTNLKRVVLCISPKNCIFNIVSGELKFKEPKVIDGNDIQKLIKKSISNKTTKDYELVTAIPINFKINNDKTVKDPKGIEATILEVKAVISETPRESLYNFLGALDVCGLEVIDIAYTTTGDYFAVRNSDLDKKVGVVINIGEDSTNVSLYNKGIMIKNSTINVGSFYIDHDLSYIYNIDLEKARELKEKFVVASSRYADIYDKIELETKGGTKYNVTQMDVSKVVEARIEEILKVAKKEIKNLTNRKISYIIVVGGLSEITGFNYLVESVLGNLAYTYNSTIVGLRDNSFTSVLGLIKYFDNKSNLRNTEYDMFSQDDMKKIINVRSKDNKEFQKVFDYFLQNKEDKVC